MRRHLLNVLATLSLLLLSGTSGCVTTEERMESRGNDVVAHLRLCRTKSEAEDYLNEERLGYGESQHEIAVSIPKDPSITDLGFRAGYYIVVELTDDGSVKSVSGQTAWTGM
jgi:hypothetical protein